MLTFKVTTVGASAGFILPKEAMAQLKVQKGDTLYLTDAPGGGYRLSPYDGFADGNKRTAWVIARLFLADNGFRLVFDPRDAVMTMEAVAAGGLEESALAAWFRRLIAN